MNGIEEFEGGGDWPDELSGDGVDGVDVVGDGGAVKKPPRDWRNQDEYKGRGGATGPREVADLLAGRPKSVKGGSSGGKGEGGSGGLLVGVEEGSLDRSDFYKMTPEEEGWLRELPPDLSRSIEDDWEWVTLHLDNRWLRVQEIPHPRAWSMLKWARKGNNRGMLYTRIMDGVVKSRSKERGGADGGEGERDELDQASARELEDMLREAIEEALSTRMVKGGALEMSKRRSGAKGSRGGSKKK